MRKDKQNKAIVDNVLVPSVDILVGELPIPGVSAAWFAVKNIYGLLADVSEEDVADFLKKVNQNLDNLDKEILQIKEFQQGLLIQIEELLRTRNKNKKEILKRIFVDGFLESDDKENFELEKMNNVIRLLSLDDIEFLRLFKDGHKMSINVQGYTPGKMGPDDYGLEKLKFLSGTGLLLERIKLRDRNKQVMGVIVGGDVDYKLSNFGKEFIKYIKA